MFHLERFLVCFLVCSSFCVPLFATVSGQTSCPEGWTEFEDACYNVTATEHTKDAASAGCAAIGGYLTVPASQAQNDFVAGLLPGQQFWVACTYFADFERIDCEDGDTEVRYRGWDYWPENFDCVYLVNGSWFDARCDETKRALCKQKPQLEPHASHGPANESCSKILQRWRLLLFSRLTGSVLREIDAVSIRSCASACDEEPLCRSFNFIPKTAPRSNACQLNGATRFDTSVAPTYNGLLPSVYGEK